ncbi:MAG: hypothetical protein R2729_12135 [Bryobacteraceae bacterium]
MPESTVIPEIPYPDIGEAIYWLAGAFGFRLRIRVNNHRAQMNVGAGAVVLVEGNSNGKDCSVMVRVDDVDAHCDRARRFGARILHEPETYAYGERQYSVSDVAGNCWHFSQSVDDVDPRAWGAVPGRHAGN